MTTTRESLAATELAYQQAPRATSEPARLARLAAVRQAVADGWTHAAIAEAMGKSRGWVGQRATVAVRLNAVAADAPMSLGDDLQQQLRRVDATLKSGRGPQTYAKRRKTEIEQQMNTAAAQRPAGTGSRAIDRFRRTET